jgi:SNF2 family DNA or RNA helicase
MKVKYKYKTKPYKHQQDCLEKCWDKKIFALFMEMGTGKSKVLIDNMSILYEQDRINFAVVIAPKGVYRNWSEKEIPEHMPDRIKREVIVWKTKLSQADKEILVKMKEDPSYEPLVIFVINVEAFSSLRGKKVADWLTSNGYGSRGMITVDESTTIKNHKAKRTKTLINMSKYFQYKRILTGSPVANSPLDLYSQCEFLGEKILGYDSYYPFQARYAVMHRKNMGTISFNQVLGYRNIDELTRKIDDFSDRVLKKDCLDLPEKIYTSRSVSMNPDQIRMYEEIRKKSILMIDKDMVSANMVATQLLRLQQILSGHLRSDDGDLIKFPTRRLDALVEICEEASGKVIIWSRFRYDVITITEKLNKTFGSQFKKVAVSFFGDTSDNERQENIKLFQDPKSSVRFFVGNPQTAGRGITLTEANTVIYYANDFNLETRIQSEDRCHRIGQHNPVTYIDLITDGTIDGKIVKSLRNKINLSAKVLGEKAREWLKLST